MTSIVWLASHPKSGNTWLRLLLANLLSGAERPVDINQLGLAGFFPVWRKHVDQIALIDTELLRPSETDMLRPHVIRELLEREGPDAGDQFVKVHDAYRYLPDGSPLLAQGVARAALYILRDPRDVAVSMSHYYNMTLDQAITHLNQGWIVAPPSSYPKPQVPQTLLDWSSHVRSWTEQQDVPTHVLRYESLLSDTISVLSRVADFLGLPASPTDLEKAARYSHIGELQRQESERGFSELPLWAGDRFFRTGKAGSWIDVLSAAQADAITTAHRDVMAAYGYI